MGIKPGRPNYATQTPLEGSCGPFYQPSYFLNIRSECSLVVEGKQLFMSLALARPRRYITSAGPPSGAYHL